MGRRRVLLLVAGLITWLNIAALKSNEWVEGYLEFAPVTPNRILSGIGGRPGGLGDKALGAVTWVEFEAGLSVYEQEVLYTFPHSQEQVEIEEFFPVSAFVNDFNAATSVPGSYSYGMSPMDGSVFSSTMGLIAFAVTLMLLAFGLVASVHYELPYVGTHKYSLWTARLLLAFAAFFDLVGVLVFGTSSVKTQICSAVDPDAQVTNMSCGFSEGFGSAVTALVFSILLVAYAWIYVSAVPMAAAEGESASLSTPFGAQKSSDTGAALFTGSSFQSSGAADTAVTVPGTATGGSTSVTMKGGYQSI